MCVCVCVCVYKYIKSCWWHGFPPLYLSIYLSVYLSLNPVIFYRSWQVLLTALENLNRTAIRVSWSISTGKSMCRSLQNITYELSLTSLALTCMLDLPYWHTLWDGKQVAWQLSLCLLLLLGFFSDFNLPFCYYIWFWTHNIGKGINYHILSEVWIKRHYFSFSVKMALALYNPQRLIYN